MTPPAALPSEGRRGVTAILLAGGSGTRLRHSQNKVYVPLADKPLLAWSLRAFERSDLVEDIGLVIRDDDRPHVEDVLLEEPVTKLRWTVSGGRTRHDSEKAGLDAVAADVASGHTDLILVHDAARPFVSSELLARLIDAARLVGGAIPGLRIEEPLYRRAEDGTAERVPAGSLRRVQTPQAFRGAPLLAAYRAAEAEHFRGVDTSQTVERYSDLDVTVIPGDPRNVKVTYAEDLVAVEELAARWSE